MANTRKVKIAISALLFCAISSVPVESTAASEQTYIVLYKQSSTFTVASKETTEETKYGNEVIDTYSGGIKGLEVKLNSDDVSRLKSDPSVAVVSPVKTYIIDPIVELSAPKSWGIDRIDQRRLPLNSAYSPRLSGAGVRAYVIDTGVYQNHPEFSGRIESGFDGVGDGNGSNDCHRHGTHVAGTIGGKTVGVAPAVQIVPVRVLNCFGQGDSGSIISGIEYVINNAKIKGIPAVANLSLGSPGIDLAIDFAIERLVDSGVTTVVAAGNSASNACNVSPARVSKAITVGATTSDDYQSSYSNFGSCVDIYAPGSNIFSTLPTGYGVLSGTSMASPHVAGAAALLLSASKSASPATITRTIIDGATNGLIFGLSSGSPNKLLFVEPISVPTSTTTTSTTSTTSSTTTTTTVATGSPSLESDSLSKSSMVLQSNIASNAVYWTVRVRDPFGGRLTSSTVGARLCPESSTWPDGPGCTGASAVGSGNSLDRTYTFLFLVSPVGPTGQWLPRMFGPVSGQPDVVGRARISIGSTTTTSSTTTTTTAPTTTSTVPGVRINGYLVGPGANLQGANLQGANLAGLNLSSANLIGANLIGANLQGSNLSSANLYGANLGSANLRVSNLRNANFTSAELNRVDMRGADITGTVFTNASYFLTILPDGSTR